MGAGLYILEHMLFKGTEKRGSGEIARQIQEQGGCINAYTSFDRTVYWIDVFRRPPARLRPWISWLMP